MKRVISFLALVVLPVPLVTGFGGAPSAPAKLPAIFCGGRLATVASNAGTIFGTEADDVIVAVGSNPHTVRALAGNDVVCGGTGADAIYGGEGRDRIDVASGETGDDVILGGDGDDVLAGGVGTDAIYGGPGRDTVVADDPADFAFDDEPAGLGVEVSGGASVRRSSGGRESNTRAS